MISIVGNLLTIICLAFVLYEIAPPEISVTLPAWPATLGGQHPDKGPSVFPLSSLASHLCGSVLGRLTSFQVCFLECSHKR